MTVKELIAFLRTQNPEAEIRVIEHHRGKGYYDQGGNAYEVSLSPEKHVEFTEWPDGDKWLLLGAYNL